VLPGTNRKIGQIIEERSGKVRNKDFAVVSNPEFLREGSAVYDYYNPPVTVLGSDHSPAMDQVELLYATLPAPVRKVEIEVAELIKYVNNAWHALKISFANEIGNICKKLLVDSHELMDLFTMDHKLNLSAYYLKPGPAYGGSCLPKDLKALRTIAHDHYLRSPVLENIENSNQVQKQIVLEMIESAGRRKIGLIGLSFKPGTDDLRHSPYVEMAEYLLGKGYEITIYDKSVNMSKLLGSNRQFIESHIPSLANLISDNLPEVISRSKTIVIAHKMAELDIFIRENPDKLFIDLVRIGDYDLSNYEGICW
jgi:GDP-mannose 6-dehydrogenase